ncbi:MAG TPA: hypothetical protein ENK26_12130 [Gammaproteobacteria bacterium]|nr:hypothetical protein [Gammaproteobacteria bacterium]
MAISQQNQVQIENVANEALDTFAKVAEAAQSKLNSSAQGVTPTNVAVNNTFTGTEAVKTQSNISVEIQEGYARLCKEPAIARVVVEDDSGVRHTYYYCRKYTVTLHNTNIKLASYLSPSRVARLPSLPVGEIETITLGGKDVEVEVIEVARFHPEYSNAEWDARNSSFDGESYGPITVESLRALLKKSAGDDIDESLLDSLLNEETDEGLIVEGLRRNVIKKMGLRDQPILDQYQDEIFRLPLDSQLLILGAPGTGKTTTLIRRLGQKLDIDFLDENEKRLVQADNPTGRQRHSESWVMFTPTELLKLYVKEAFAKEGVAAPDDRIRTWTSFRDNLARNQFKILRSATSNSGFRMDPARPAGTLAPDTIIRQTVFFEDFDNWQREAFIQEMNDAARKLGKHSSPEISNFGDRAIRLIEKSGTSPRPSLFADLLGLSGEIQTTLGRMKEESDKLIRSTLNLQVNKDRQFLDDLAKFLESLVESDEEPEDQEADDEDSENTPRFGRQAAFTRYFQAVRAVSRSKAGKRKISPKSNTGKILDWIGDRLPQDSDLLTIGESLVVQFALRWFANPVRRYVDGTPGRYRQFRRLRQTENRWFSQKDFNRSDLHPIEVDAILLAMLQISDEIVTGPRILSDSEGPVQAIVERMEDLYQTQVLVDEVTDFSPLQLACMAKLARPGIRSFFACGDFNQRVTSWGTRTQTDMDWALPKIQTREITVAYRQTRNLHDFARKIVEVSGETSAEVILPEYAENEGVPPLLAVGMDNLERTSKWLGERIKEIERSLHDLPSIAILVNSEAEVLPVAERLGGVLSDLNIRVVPCPNGQVRGNESEVRVFSVEHIKGLEFEAVFFVGLDRLAEQHPDLFDKYLYVGATRAATYLGLTCETDLPEPMNGLADLFGDSWA